LPPGTELAKRVEQSQATGKKSGKSDKEAHKEMRLAARASLS